MANVTIINALSGATQKVAVNDDSTLSDVLSAQGISSSGVNLFVNDRKSPPSATVRDGDVVTVTPGKIVGNG